MQLLSVYSFRRSTLSGPWNDHRQTGHPPLPARQLQRQECGKPASALMAGPAPGDSKSAWPRTKFMKSFAKSGLTCQPSRAFAGLALLLGMCAGYVSYIFCINSTETVAMMRMLLQPSLTVPGHSCLVHIIPRANCHAAAAC